jgi:hypothetical protein
VAAECDGEAPRRERAPLGGRPDPAALKRWLRRWTNVRHREAAERTLLTAIAAGLSPAVLADALLAADGEQLDELPANAEMIRAALLDAFDRQRQVDLAARLVARHLTLGHSTQALITTLAHALLREDAGFHAYQMLEAGVRQSAAWGDTDEGRHILIAVARYLAAHSPTERAALQTADIARRLMRGGELHQEARAS